VLTQSARLTTDDLVEIAGTMSQQHLLAISGRGALEEVVTDVLLDRGDREIVHRLARNAGARFSETGFTTLVHNAETDESLAEKLGLRLDIPLRVLRDLLLKATEAVRARLLALAPPETKNEIQRALAKISNEVSREATASRDFTQAQLGILQMKKEGQAGRSGAAGIREPAPLRADGRGSFDAVLGVDRFDRIPDERRAKPRITDSLQGRRSEMADGDGDIAQPVRPSHHVGCRPRSRQRRISRSVAGKRATRSPVLGSSHEDSGESRLTPSSIMYLIDCVRRS
jgi:hypothetical protein